MNSEIHWGHKNRGEDIAFPGPTLVSGGRSYQNPYWVSYRENYFEKGSDPLQLPPRLPFSWTYRSQPPRAYSTVERRVESKYGRTKGRYLTHVPRWKNLETAKRYFNSTISCLAVCIHDSGNTFEEGTYYVKILHWAYWRQKNNKLETQPSGMQNSYKWREK